MAGPPNWCNMQAMSERVNQVARLKRAEAWLSLAGSAGFVVSMASVPTAWARAGRFVLAVAGACWFLSAVAGLSGLYFRRRSSVQAKLAEPV